MLYSKIVFKIIVRIYHNSRNTAGKDQKKNERTY